MHIAGYNWVAILVAALAAQPVGALWFSRLLFAKAWMAEVGFTEEQIKANPSRMPFVVGFLSPLAMAAVLAWLTGATGWTGVGGGIGMGVLAALGLVAAGGAPHYAFSGKSLRLFLIDMGHTVAVLVVVGAIVGAWR